jgi:hypothetical protein
MTIAVRLDTTQAGPIWAESVGVSSGASMQSLDRDAVDLEYRKIAGLFSADDDIPSDGAVLSATQFLPIIVARASKLGCWVSPHMTVSESGEVVFEWWRGAKKVTLYFGDGAPEFLRVWGTNIETEMDSGELTEGWSLTSLFHWLNS